MDAVLRGTVTAGYLTQYHGHRNLRRDPQLPQSRHQVFLRPVALHPIAVSAHQLQVLDVVLATGPLRDDVIHLQNAERELAAASVAPALLLAEQDVFVLPVGHWDVDVGAPRDVAGNPYSPQAVVFLTSFIDVIVGY